MTNDSTKSSISQPASDTAVYLFDDWFDPIEAGVRDRVRGFIEAMIEGELDSALLRPRYGRKPKLANEDADGSAGVTGHRHGQWSRSLMGTFGCVEIGVRDELAGLKALQRSCRFGECRFGDAVYVPFNVPAKI